MSPDLERHAAVLSDRLETRGARGSAARCGAWENRGQEAGERV